MAKYTQYQQLPKDKKQQVLLELCHALAMVKTLPEVAKVLGDLLSDQEIQMVGKRLQIAKLLLDKKTYAEVCDELKVSPPTVARVNMWLQQAGEGFRLVIKKGLGQKSMKIPDWKPPATAGQMTDSWAYIKRKYPLYFWPQLLVEEIVRTANNKQRKRLLETLSILRKSGKGKKEVFRHIEEVLRAQRVSKPTVKAIEREVALDAVSGANKKRRDRAGSKMKQY